MAPLASRGTGLEVLKGSPTSGEYTVALVPRKWTGDGSVPLAIYAPALSAGAWNMMGWYVALSLAHRGFVVVSSDLGDTPATFGASGIPASVGGTGQGGEGVWGNDAAMTKLSTLRTWAQARYGTSGQVLLMGGSHGGATATRWAAQNPSLVNCLLLGIGCVDIQDTLTNNRPGSPGYAASIQKAWGLGSGVTLPAGSTGVQNATSLTMPVRTYYSDDDTVTPAARQLAFAAANPTKITAVSFGAVGHSLVGFPAESAADWVVANA